MLEKREQNKWFCSRFRIILIKNTGRRKKTKYTMLVEAMDTKDAHFIVESELRDDEILKIEKLDVEDVIS